MHSVKSALLLCVIGAFAVSNQPNNIVHTSTYKVAGATCLPLDKIAVASSSNTTTDYPAVNTKRSDASETCWYKLNVTVPTGTAAGLEVLTMNLKTDVDENALGVLNLSYGFVGLSTSVSDPITCSYQFRFKDAKTYWLCREA